MAIYTAMDFYGDEDSVYMVCLRPVVGKSPKLKTAYGDKFYHDRFKAGDIAKELNSRHKADVWTVVEVERVVWAQFDDYEDLSNGDYWVLDEEHEAGE